MIYFSSQLCFCDFIVYVVISLSSSTFGAHMEFSRRLTLVNRGDFDHHSMLLLQKKTMATGGLYEQGLPGPASSTNSQLQTITQVSSPSVTKPFYNCSPFPGKDSIISLVNK